MRHGRWNVAAERWYMSSVEVPSDGENIHASGSVYKEMLLGRKGRLGTCGFVDGCLWASAIAPAKQKWHSWFFTKFCLRRVELLKGSHKDTEQYLKTVKYIESSALECTLALLCRQTGLSPALAKHFHAFPYSYHTFSCSGKRPVFCTESMQLNKKGREPSFFL